MPTLNEVAQRLDVHATTISRLRAGVRSPSLALMLRIRDAYDLSIAEQTAAWRDGRFGKLLDERVFLADSPQRTKR